jgi:cell division protein FtsW (lipid II flippase)
MMKWLHLVFLWIFSFLKYQNKQENKIARAMLLFSSSPLIAFLYLFNPDLGLHVVDFFVFLFFILFHTTCFCLLT